jgi:hypothetical protein
MRWLAGAGGGGIGEMGVTGEGGHLGQMARNWNRVIPKTRKLNPRKSTSGCIEAAFPVTATISFIFYGKIMFDLRIFLRAHFQERNYRVNWEVAVDIKLFKSVHVLAFRSQIYDFHCIIFH